MGERRPAMSKRKEAQQRQLEKEDDRQEQQQQQKLYPVQQSATFAGGTLLATPRESLAITAEPMQKDTILSCQWQYIGETFETIGSNNGCAINLKLSEQPGSGFLTLQASQDFCNQSSVFSLEVQIAESK